jgi:hypothetical protein
VVTSDLALHGPVANIPSTVGKHCPMRILRCLTVTKENLLFWLPGMCRNVPAKPNCEDRSTFRNERQFDCEASKRDAAQAPRGNASREIVGYQLGHGVLPHAT